MTVAEAQAGSLRHFAELVSPFMGSAARDTFEALHQAADDIEADHHEQAEIMFMNDEAGSYPRETPDQRWSRMRAWIASNIKPEGAPQ